MRIFALLPFVLLLTACNDLFPLNTQDMCEEQAQLCSDLNPDGWCLAEKKRIINHRYEYLKAPSEIIDYRLLVDFEDYKVCISKAAQVVHIKQVEKQAYRMQAVVVAEKELQRLATKTQDSSEPHLLLYHWSRFGKKAALQKFLSLEQEGKLNHPELQVGLASYYVKFDRKKAIATLYRALELYRPQDQLDSEIFTSLSTLYMKGNDFKNAYIWGKVAEKFLKKDINMALIKAQLRTTDKIKTLDEQAEKHVDAIEDRRFKSPL